MKEMRLVVLLLGLLVGACGGATSPATLDNRGGTESITCELPARFDFEARRYANLDADQPGYQTWSAWRVGIQLSDRARVRGTRAMVGDELVWSFDFTGKLAGCRLELWTDTHEPFTTTIDLRTRTGTIRSIDDVWLLGPPFPAQR